MNSWTEKVSDWWDARNLQEQRTLKIAVPIIILMLIYLLVVEPVMRIYSAQKAEYQDAQDTLVWLYDQAPLVGRMKNSCGQRLSYIQDGGDPQALVQTIARRSNISAKAEAESGAESLSITVSSAQGNRLLNYVQALSCNGFSISGLEIQRNATTTNVSARLNAIPVVLPRLN